MSRRERLKKKKKKGQKKTAIYFVTGVEYPYWKAMFTMDAAPVILQE